MNKERPYYKPCSTCTDEFCVFMGTEDTHAICESYKPLEQEPCNDAISRQAVLEKQYRIDDSATLSTRDVVNVDDIEDLPPVTPHPKTGYWVEENVNGGGRRVFCSECGCPPPFEHVSTGDVYSANGYGVINKTKFCPSCGTRMIEPKESDVPCGDCDNCENLDGDCCRLIYEEKSKGV